MIVTKEAWAQLNTQSKIAAITECLEELYKIEHGVHPLSNTPEQGKLCQLKQQLESFVAQSMSWDE